MKMFCMFSLAIMIGFACFQSTQSQIQELHGQHRCTKIVKYETIEAYYERQKCGPKTVSTALQNTRENCNPKEKHRIQKKYRKVYRYKKIYVCCPGYVRVWHRCVKGKTTERPTTLTTNSSSMTTLPTITTPTTSANVTITPTTTTNVTITPTTTTNVTITPDVTTSHMPMDKCVVDEIIIVLIVMTVITVTIVVLSCLLCVVCYCKLQERQKKCKCYEKDVSEKTPITKRSTNGNERTYNHYDSCVSVPGEKQQYDNNTYQQRYVNNYEDLHRYDNTQNAGQLENTYAGKQ